MFNILSSTLKYSYPYLLYILLMLNLLSLFYRKLEFSHYGNLSIKVTLITSIIILIGLLIFSKETFVKIKFFLPLYISIITLIAIYIFSHILNSNIHYDKYLLITLVSFLVIALLFLVTWPDHFLITSSIVSNLLILFIFINWLKEGLPTNRFGYVYLNTNLFAIVLFCLTFFQTLILNKLSTLFKGLQFILIIFSTILIYVTSSRATLVILITVLFMYFIYLIFPRMYSKLFYLQLILGIVFVFIYSFSSNLQLFKYLNEISLKLFKKGIFSGREWIWRDALDFSKESLLLGHHVNVSPFEYIPNTHIHHVHNLYVQVLLEVGIIGLIGFISFLYMVWRVLLKNINVLTVRMSTCYFLAILLYWSIDLNSFHSNEAIHYLFWLIIGIGVSQSVNESLKQNRGFS